VIKVLDLLAKYEVLKESWSPLASFEAGAILNRTACIGRNERIRVVQRELFQEIGIVLKISYLVLVVFICIAFHIRTCCMGQAQKAQCNP